MVHPQIARLGLTLTSAPGTSPRSKGVAVVTGGTAGVGRATVRAFAAAGYDVGVLARGRAGLDGVRAEVQAAGRRCVTVQADVASADDVDAAAARIETELGPITVWVNNAFVGALSWFWDTTEEEYRRITDVTYLGQVHGMQAALRLMRPRDVGSVVNVSSALAHRGIPLQAAYCGAKHAIKGATESVVTELRAEGSAVAVSLVTLPGVDTPQFTWNLNKMSQNPAPVPPLVEPEVCAAAILFAAEHPRRDSWVGVGTVFTVLGGRLAPRFMDWYLARTGIDSQQTDRDTGRRKHNLYEARDETDDVGARGAFGDQARGVDPVAAVGRVRARLAGRTRKAVVGVASTLRSRS